MPLARQLLLSSLVKGTDEKETTMKTLKAVAVVLACVLCPVVVVMWIANRE